MTTQNNDRRPIDYQSLIEDIRHELKKLYHLNMHPALVLDTIDILIHEQTGLECVADTTERHESSQGNLFTQCDFVVLTHNHCDASKQGPVEAWAYLGPLDFDRAQSLVFGAGNSPFDALSALTMQLKDL